MSEEGRTYNLLTRGGCTKAYEDIANAADKAKDELTLKKLILAKKCTDGTVYLNGNLPIKAAQLIHAYKGTPYVDIPLLEVEGEAMIRHKKSLS